MSSFSIDQSTNINTGAAVPNSGAAASAAADASVQARANAAEVSAQARAAAAEVSASGTADELFGPAVIIDSKVTGMSGGSAEAVNAFLNASSYPGEPAQVSAQIPPAASLPASAQGGVVSPEVGTMQGSGAAYEDVSVQSGLASPKVGTVQGSGAAHADVSAQGGLASPEVGTVQGSGTAYEDVSAQGGLASPEVGTVQASGAAYEDASAQGGLASPEVGTVQGSGAAHASATAQSAGASPADSGMQASAPAARDSADASHSVKAAVSGTPSKTSLGTVLPGIYDIAREALSAAGQQPTQSHISLIQAMCSGSMPIDSASVSEVLLSSFAITDRMEGLIEVVCEALNSGDCPEELRSELSRIAFGLLGTDDRATSSVILGDSVKSSPVSPAEILMKRFSVALRDISAESLQKLYKDAAEFASALEHLTAEHRGHEGRHSASIHAKALQTARSLSALADPGRLFPYLEIPFRLSDSRGSASLFVRRDKRHRDISPSGHSALLRLDMPNLGAIDISIRLHEKQLSLSFFGEADTLGLLRSDINSLTDRLSADGFTVTKAFTSSDKDTGSAFGPLGRSSGGLDDHSVSPSDPFARTHTADTSSSGFDVLL